MRGTATSIKDLREELSQQGDARDELEHGSCGEKATTSTLAYSPACPREGDREHELAADE
jgi:hypothetical protein